MLKMAVQTRMVPRPTARRAFALGGLLCSALASAQAPPAQSAAQTPEEQLAGVSSRIDGQIAEIEKALAKIPEGPKKADLLVQQAQLWWEKGKLAASLSKECARCSPDAIRLYQKVLSDYPSYAHADQALFNLANLLYEVGRKQEATARYREVIARFPDSLSTLAYVQMGDHFFDSSAFDQARKAYQVALTSNDAKIYAYALYKLAWCDFDSGNYDEAVRNFQKVIDYETDVLRGGGPVGRRDAMQMRDEAKKDMALARERAAQHSPTTP